MQYVCIVYVVYMSRFKIKKKNITKTNENVGYNNT